MRTGRAVWVSVAYLLIGSAVMVAIYALTPSTDRTDLIGQYAPILIAGVPGVLAWLKAYDGAEQAVSNGRKLNGDLDQRIQAAVAQVFDNRPQDSRSGD